MAITHLSPDEGDSFSALGERTMLKIRHGAYSVFESWGEPGQGLPPHVHEDQDEAIYVLAGEYRLSSGDTVTLGAGSTAFITRGTVHALTVGGTGPARCLQIFDPPGAMERVFDELRAGTVDDALTVARRHGIHLLTHPA